MIHIMDEQKKRGSLREEQARHTRELILEGLIRVMAHGNPTEITIPAVARESGVSVPTIYRYFSTKEELLKALGDYSMQRFQLAPPMPPQSPEDLVTMIQQVFSRYAESEELLRATALSEQLSETRDEMLPWRIKYVDLALESLAQRLSEQERIYLRTLVLILTTTSSVRAFTDYLDLSITEAIDTVAWMIRTLSKESSKES
ncbi:TetR/AcrR family transcriptional regulator [Ktedonobacteria bacterium brp13]|nr:TetR/AcrR family transcriptional regulator [Ktedonobacteria bacterium brp13]